MARSRRRQRGAAAVEGAMTMTLFVLIFGGIWAALGFFRAKIDVMQEARADAWQTALDPCGGSGILGSVKDQLLEQVDSGDTSGGNEKFGDFESSLDQSGGYVTTNATATNVSNSLIGGGVYKPEGKMHIRCNEDISNDSLSSIAGEAMGMAKDMIF